VARDVFEQYFGIKDHRSDDVIMEQVRENLSNIAAD
jgi:hypothetical protein